MGMGEEGRLDSRLLSYQVETHVLISEMEPRKFAIIPTNPALTCGTSRYARIASWEGAAWTWSTSCRSAGAKWRSTSKTQSEPDRLVELIKYQGESHSKAFGSSLKLGKSPRGQQAVSI